MKNGRLRALWVIGGAALFALLSQAEVYPLNSWNHVSLGMLAMAVCCLEAGAVAGGLAGGLGQLLYYGWYYHLDWTLLLRLGPRFMGMALGTAAAGLLLGALFHITNAWEKWTLRLLLNLAAALLASAAGLWLISSLADAFLQGYSLQMALWRNRDWFVYNGAMVMASVPVAMILHPLLNSIRPVSAEEAWKRESEQKKG